MCTLSSQVMTKQQVGRSVKCVPKEARSGEHEEWMEGTDRDKQTHREIAWVTRSKQDNTTHTAPLQAPKQQQVLTSCRGWGSWRRGCLGGASAGCCPKSCNKTMVSDNNASSAVFALGTHAATRKVCRGGPLNMTLRGWKTKKKG